MKYNFIIQEKKRIKINFSQIIFFTFVKYEDAISKVRQFLLEACFSE